MRRIAEPWSAGGPGAGDVAGRESAGSLSTTKADRAFQWSLNAGRSGGGATAAELVARDFISSTTWLATVSTVS